MPAKLPVEVVNSQLRHVAVLDKSAFHSANVCTHPVKPPLKRFRRLGAVGASTHAAIALLWLLAVMHFIRSLCDTINPELP